MVYSERSFLRGSMKTSKDSWSIIQVDIGFSGGESAGLKLISLSHSGSISSTVLFFYRSAVPMDGFSDLNKASVSHRPVGIAPSYALDCVWSSHQAGGNSLLEYLKRRRRHQRPCLRGKWRSVYGRFYLGTEHTQSFSWLPNHLKMFAQSRSISSITMRADTAEWLIDLEKISAHRVICRPHWWSLCRSNLHRLQIYDQQPESCSALLRRKDEFHTVCMKFSSVTSNSFL